MSKPKLSPAAARARQAIKEILDMDVEDSVAEKLAAAILAKPSKEPTKLQEMTATIIELCGWPKAEWARATRSAKKILDAGLCKEDLLLHYGPTDPGPTIWWWYRNGDFRNKSGLWAEWIVNTMEKWGGDKTKPTITPQPQPKSPRDAARERQLEQIRQARLAEVSCGD